MVNRGLSLVIKTESISIKMELALRRLRFFNDFLFCIHPYDLFAGTTCKPHNTKSLRYQQTQVSTLIFINKAYYYTYVLLVK